MNIEQVQALTMRETDLEGAIKRFCGDEALYVSCLGMFLKDETMEQLNQAIDEQRWDDAFTAAHALKGVAGNMGFVPLMHAISKLVVQIRSGRLADISSTLVQVNEIYREIIDVVQTNFILTEKS